jgi:hypothetical protein
MVEKTIHYSYSSQIRLIVLCSVIEVEVLSATEDNQVVVVAVSIVIRKPLQLILVDPVPSVSLQYLLDFVTILEMRTCS